MDYNQLRENFHQQVYPSHPNEWEVDDVLEDLVDLEEEQQLILLQTVPAVWPISHSLCFSLLHEGARQAPELNRQKFAEWLRRVLYNYEEGGLLKARAYMAESEIGLLGEAEKEKAVSLEKNLLRLSTYSRAITSSSIELQVADAIYTDTEMLFLPETIDCFATNKQNFLLYKLMITLQCVFIRLATFSLHNIKIIRPQSTTVVPGDKNSVGFFETFHIQRLAEDIFQLVELAKAFTFLGNNYSGLKRESYAIRKKIIALRSLPQNEKNRCMDSVLSLILLPELQHTEIDFGPVRNLASIENGEQAFDLVSEIYTWVSGFSGEYRSMSLRPLMDDFNFADAQRTTEKRIERNRKKFKTVLSDFLLKKNILPKEPGDGNSAAESADSAKLVLVEAAGKADENRSVTLSIDNESIELPEELVELIKNIQSDLGDIPEGYVSAAFGLAGPGRQAGEGQRDDFEEVCSDFQSYDEWDYRRQGYRKGWCKLRQRPLPRLRSDFVARTLAKYRGVLSKIKRQFEMMRTQERFARRRRYGDDIDLDAFVDSLCDQRAGLPASENLYVQLLRNERSISTLFLVDMSNSTEGWVGVAIKEALVLLCEALETVGDQYAIYGFSGMRRSRSEVYQIKEISEKYGEEVKARVGAISPKEYTRMGPPIRHMISHLSQLESKTRLLIILSDGKPEDYDDYKGQYAIEDTRKALAEAKGAGIHPFCITIDRQAHTYLEYLFGRGNFIFVQDVASLPSRLTEIYRLVTR